MYSVKIEVTFAVRPAPPVFDFISSFLGQGDEMTSCDICFQLSILGAFPAGRLETRSALPMLCFSLLWNVFMRQSLMLDKQMIP